MTVIWWALTSAVLYGTGAALQQRQAATTPSQAAGRPRLLLLLIRRPWWLLGIGVEIGGFATHAVALRTGPLTTVQMLVASSLLFSVVTVRLWSGRRMSWTAWAAVIAVSAGIGSFVALASPAGGAGGGGPAMAGHAGLAAACLATCAVPLAAVGLTSAGRRRAVLLAVAAGLADAGVAVVTMAFWHVVSSGLTGMASSWPTYALLLGGPCSLLLTQTAYQAGRPMITLPVIAVVNPLASLVAGNLLLGESARLSVLSGAVAVLAVLAMSAGLVMLARLTTGQPGGATQPGDAVASPAWPSSDQGSDTARGSAGPAGAAHVDADQAAIGGPAQRGALVLVMGERGALVTGKQGAVCVHDAPPGHGAAPQGHDATHLARAALAEVLGDVSVGHDLTRRDGLDDVQDARGVVGYGRGLGHDADSADPWPPSAPGGGPHSGKLA